MGEQLPVDPSLLPTQVTNYNSVYTASGFMTNQKPRSRNFPRPIDNRLGNADQRQEYDDCRTIEGWTSFIHKLLKAAWTTPDKVPQWRFGHDFGLLPQDPQQLVGAMIVYEVISMVPAEYRGRKEIKPRVREVLGRTGTVVPTASGAIGAPDPVDTGKVMIWAQSMDCVIAFTVYGDTWGRSIEYTDKFMDFMTMFFGAFKQYGLQEICFRGQMRDALYDPPRVQEFPNRTLFYDVRIEKVTTVTAAEIEQIYITAGIQNLLTNLSGDASVTALVDGIEISPIEPGSAPQ